MGFFDGDVTLHCHRSYFFYLSKNFTYTCMSNRKVPGHFILASNLILVVLVLSIVYQFLPNIHILAGMLPVVIGTKVLLLALAILLRLGYSWSKYLLAVLALLTLLGIRDVLDVFMYPAVSTILNIIQVALIMWATIVVFKKHTR